MSENIKNQNREFGGGGGWEAPFPIFAPLLSNLVFQAVTLFSQTGWKQKFLFAQP